MIYRDAAQIETYMTGALEHIQDNKGLRHLFNRMSLIDELYTHVAGVAKLGTALALDVALPEKDIREVALAGMLHDAGKIHVPREILFKPGKLTDEEFAAIKRHPLDGYEDCKPYVDNEDVLQMILNHHEKTDGSGYPNGTSDLSLKCRILTVADIFSALVEPRLYHRERSVVDALEFIACFNDIDQDLVSRLHKLVEPEEYAYEPAHRHFTKREN